MTKKSPVANVELVDFPVEAPKPKGTTKRAQPEWDGRSTKVPLFRPLIRDNVTTGPDERCIDCRRDGIEDPSHQFHLRCSKDASGQWVGPDADHMRELIGTVQVEYAINKDGSKGEQIRAYIKGGVVAGTDVERAYMASRRYERELMGHQYDMGSGELGQWTVEDLRAAMKSELGEDGRTIDPGIERDLRETEAGRTRQAVEDLAATIEPLVRALVAERIKTE